MLWLLLIAISWAVPTVAITDLANHTGDPAFDGAGPGVAGILVARFQDTDAITVIERQALVALLAEQRLTVAGLTDPETAVRAGRLLGADFLVVGELFSVKLPTVSIALRVVDAATGEVVVTEEVVGDVGERGELFFELVDRLSDDILAALDIELASEDRQRLSAIERRELSAVIRYGEDLTRVNTEHPMALYRDSSHDFSKDKYYRTHWRVYEQDGTVIPMPYFARRVGDADTNLLFMNHLIKLRRRAVRNNLITLGYGLTGVALIIAGSSIGNGDGDPDTPTALQWTGGALVAACPIHLLVNVFVNLGNQQTALFPRTYYTAEEADRWIHDYNSSLR